MAESVGAASQFAVYVQVWCTAPNACRMRGGTSQIIARPRATLRHHRRLPSQSVPNLRVTDLLFADVQGAPAGLVQCTVNNVRIAYLCSVLDMWIGGGTRVSGDQDRMTHTRLCNL